MQHSVLDSLGGPALFLLTAAILTVAGEAGFRAAYKFGRARQASQANVVTAALLGILGLLLAFSFGIVEGRFSQRKALIVKEANAIEGAYRRAGVIGEPYSARARTLLREYVELKLSVTDFQRVPAALVKADREQHALWKEAEAAALADPKSVMAALFIAAVDEVIDVHHERVTVVLYHRLPSAMLITLYVVAAFCLALHGYSAGLARIRVPVPAIGLIVSLAAMLFLIVELDRPWQSVFHISQHAMVDAREAMKP